MALNCPPRSPWSLGPVWRTAKRSASFVRCNMRISMAKSSSVKLDDSCFTAPAYASLVQGDKGEHKLISSR